MKRIAPGQYTMTATTKLNGVDAKVKCFVRKVSESVEVNWYSEIETEDGQMIAQGDDWYPTKLEAKDSLDESIKHGFKWHEGLGWGTC